MQATYMSIGRSNRLKKFIALFLIPTFVTSNVSYANTPDAGRASTLAPYYISQIIDDHRDDVEKLTEAAPVGGRVARDRRDEFGKAWVAISARALASKMVARVKELDGAIGLESAEREMIRQINERARRYNMPRYRKAKIIEALGVEFAREAALSGVPHTKDGSAALTERVTRSGARNPFHLFEPGSPRGNTTIDENTVIVGTGGGDCAGLNDFIANLVLALSKEEKRVLGIKNCYDGMVSDNWQDLLVELTPETAEAIRALPSTVLGSCRRKLSEDDLDKIIARFKGAFGLVITGGNDHVKEASKISDAGSARGTPVVTVGVPKSIDNDFRTAMLGFKSAYLLGRRIAARGSVDPSRFNGARAAVFEVMGRKSGSLTVEVSKGCAFPRAVVIPERPVTIDDVIESAAGGVRNFFISEGFSLSENDPKLNELLGRYPALKARYEKSKTSPDRDNHGNPKLTGASLIVVGILEHFCGLEVQRTDITYAARGASPQVEKTGGEVFDSVLAERFAEKAAELLRTRVSGLTLTYPDYEDATRSVVSKPAGEVYASKDLKAASDGLLAGLGVLGIKMQVASELPLPVAVTLTGATKEEEARRLFYGISISTLAHRYASCVELREPSEVIVSGCGKEPQGLEHFPRGLKTIIAATRESVMLLIPEREISLGEIGEKVTEIYRKLGYVNIAISHNFRLKRGDELLERILEKDALLKAKFESEARDTGDGMVAFDSGVSHFIIGLFRELKIRNTRITDIGFALDGLTAESSADLLKDGEYLARQGVAGPASSSVRRTAAGYSGNDLLSNIIVADSMDEMGEIAARKILEDVEAAIAAKDKAVVLFASAPSQHSTWRALLKLAKEEIRQGRLDVSKIVAFHMDEYLGLPVGAEQLFGNVLKAQLFEPLGIKEEQVSYFNDRLAYETAVALRVAIASGDTERAAELQTKLEREAKAHAADIVKKFQEEGGVFDVVIGGIGKHPHVAFNDAPDARFDDPLAIKVVKLAEVSRQQQVDDGEFARIEDVPTHALTFTLPPIFGAKKLHIIVPRQFKAHAVMETLDGDITEALPASGLRRGEIWPKVTMYLDLDSASESAVAKAALEMRRANERRTSAGADTAKAVVHESPEEAIAAVERDVGEIVTHLNYSGEGVLDTSRYAVIMKRDLAAGSYNGKEAAIQHNAHDRYQVMKQRLEKLFTREDGVVEVTTQDDLVSTANVMLSKGVKVIILDDGTMTEHMDAGAIQGAVWSDYCVIAMDAVTDLDAITMPFVNLNAMALMGVGILSGDNILFELAYKAFRGVDAPKDYLAQLKAAAQWIVRVIPRIVRFTNEIRDEELIRRLFAVAA